MIKKTSIQMCFFLCFALFSSLAYAESEDSRAVIENRIKPVGEVYVKGVNPPPSDVVKKTPKKEEKQKPGALVTPTTKTQVVSGEKIYKDSCGICHDAGVAGAPKKGNAADWAERQKQGLPTMLKHAITGIRAMPPKGTCATCSKGDLKAAIEYMLPK